MRKPTAWLLVAVAVSVLAGASAAVTASPVDPIVLIGTGTVPANASDGLKLTPPILGDGTPHDRAGGFGSALAWTGFGQTYIATPDRGPANGTVGYLDRFYFLKVSVAPGAADPVTVSIQSAGLLRNQTGGTFTGLSSAFDTNNSPASLRLDPEGVRPGRNGTFFVSDEYGPFLYEFDAAGRRVRALAVPSKFLIANPNANGDLELPPGNTSGRQPNRGMEGLAITPDGTKLYGAMQNALIQDHALNASNQRRGVFNRILQIDVATGATKEFVYQLESRSYGVNEILAINDSEFLVIERDGTAPGDAPPRFKQIWKATISATTTDVSGNPSLPQVPPLPAGTNPVTKSLFLDLLSPSFHLNDDGQFPEKIEGLALGPDLPDGRHLLLVSQTTTSWRRSQRGSSPSPLIRARCRGSWRRRSTAGSRSWAPRGSGWGCATATTREPASTCESTSSRTAHRGRAASRVAYRGSRAIPTRRSS